MAYIRPAYHGESMLLGGPVWDILDDLLFCSVQCAKKAGVKVEHLTETAVLPGDTCAHCKARIIVWTKAEL